MKISPSCITELSGEATTKFSDPIWPSILTYHSKDSYMKPAQADCKLFQNTERDWLNYHETEDIVCVGLKTVSSYPWNRCPHPRKGKVYLYTEYALCCLAFPTTETKANSLKKLYGFI
jgi:hypothetical protein